MSILSKITKAAKAAAKAKAAKKKADAAKKKADAAAAKVKAAKKKAAIIAVKSKAKKDRASIDDNANEVVGTRERSGSTGNAERDIEEGKAGKVDSGDKSVVSFYDLERGNKGRNARNERVAKLETKEEKGTITKTEKAELTRLDKLSSDSNKKSTTAAAIQNSSNARKGKGVTLAGMDGNITVGRVVKQPSGEMIGDTTNGINKATGEIFGNPTINQIDMAMRDLKARKDLSAAVRRDRMATLVKQAGRTKEQRQAATIANMERRMVDTGPDKSGRKYKKGGLTTSKARTGNTDYRMGGMFMKKGKK